jgi:hypothetical protein
MLASSLTYTRKMAKHNSEISEDLPYHAENVAAYSPDSSPSNDVLPKRKPSVEHRAGNVVRSAGVGSFIQGHMSREEVLQRMNHPEEFQEIDAAIMDFKQHAGSLRKGLSREGSMSRRRAKPSSTGGGGGWGSPTGGAREGGMGGGGGDGRDGGGGGDSDGGGEKEIITVMVRAQTGIESEVGNGNEKDGDDGGDENDDDDWGESGDNDSDGNFHPPGAYELELEEEDDEDDLMMAMELDDEGSGGNLEIGV